LPEIRGAGPWADPSWKNELAKLPQPTQVVINTSLRELFEALRVCQNPQTDPTLQRWAPTRWDVPREQAAFGQWVEYRLGDPGNRARVIVCYLRDTNTIYLVSRTPIHNHDWLRRSIANWRVRANR